MSEQKWTAEPWRVVTVEEWNGPETSTYGAGSENVMSNAAYYPDAVSQADQERIVACVNACAGIHDPAAAIREAREALSDVLAATAPIIDAWDSACLVDGEHEFSEYETQAERLQRSIDMISAALRALGGDERKG